MMTPAPEFDELAAHLRAMATYVEQCAALVPTLPDQFQKSALENVRTAEQMQVSAMRFMRYEVRRLETLQRIALLQMPTGGNA